MKLVFYQPGHHKNKNSIQRMCASYSIDIEFTEDLNRISQNNYDILVCNSSYVEPHLIPENIKIIYGPQHWVFPEGPLVGQLNIKYKNRCVYNTLSKWIENCWIELVNSLTIPMYQFPFSINTELFKPNESVKSIDCLLYIKRRSNFIVNKTIKILKDKNLSYVTFNYGSYYEGNYLNSLRACKFMISLDAHESQGFALEEAMSCNVPLLVLDSTSMHDETNDGIHYTYSYLHPNKLLATSVPYWSDQCGIKITDENKMSESIDRMLTEYKKYNPREYILNTLSDKVCMKRILDYFELK